MTSSRRGAEVAPINRKKHERYTEQCIPPYGILLLRGTGWCDRISQEESSSFEKGICDTFEEAVNPKCEIQIQPHGSVALHDIHCGSYEDFSA